MTSSTEITPEQYAFWGEVKLPPWWLVLIEGILLVIIGIWLFTQPISTMTALVFVLGIYWLISGVFNLVRLIWDRSMWAWKIFAGVLGIIAGLIVIQHPWGSTVVVSNVVVFLLAMIGIFMGISSLIHAFMGGGWGAGILGVISIVLGAFLLFGDFVGVGFLAFFLGFFALLGGIGAIIGSFRIRHAEHQIEDAVEAYEDRAAVAAGDQ
ncbi:MAG: DUF308 domain-containing protein [Chloroflexota bacterium]|nr:DUF308 domain-containing protein [Chloroflexota bacterium]